MNKDDIIQRNIIRKINPNNKINKKIKTISKLQKNKKEKTLMLKLIIIYSQINEKNDKFSVKEEDKYS